MLQVDSGIDSMGDCMASQRTMRKVLLVCDGNLQSLLNEKVLFNA